MNKLTCKKLVKTYGNKKVLDNVSITLEPHRIYGLIGRNGAGKTTLLSIISGQNFADSGEVSIDGETVFENQQVLDKLCFSREINQTLLFGKDMRKVKQFLSPAELIFPYWDKEYASKLISDFELDINKRIANQSKGMLSALTIVIALASKAPITFLDEPVAGLDVFMRDKFYRLLLEEYNNSDRTFVVSTHIIDEAANMLEDIIIIESGRVIKTGNTDDLLSHHRIVSGLTSDIDEFCKNYKVTHSDTIGRSKSVCIEIDDLSRFKADASAYDFDISKASLQKLFMNLLGSLEGIYMIENKKIPSGLLRCLMFDLRLFTDMLFKYLLIIFAFMLVMQYTGTMSPLSVVLLFVGIIPMTMTLQRYTSYYSQMVGFGLSKGNFVNGSLIMKPIYMLFSMILCAVTAIISNTPKETAGFVILVAVSASLLMSSLGDLLGVLILRFNRGGYILYMTFYLLMVISISTLSGIMSAMGLDISDFYGTKAMIFIASVSGAASGIIMMTVRGFLQRVTIR